jgi:hypothetical protein
MKIARTVRPVHFEDFSGAEFERLVFAYHLCEGWTDLAWFGQTGSDQGRDIIGLRPLGHSGQARGSESANEAWGLAPDAGFGCPPAVKARARSPVRRRRRRAP